MRGLGKRRHNKRGGVQGVLGKALSFELVRGWTQSMLPDAKTPL